MTIESLVAILLLLTILYCVRLNGQLKRLRADEATMKATIAELVTATETAERAISSLKTTVREADLSLGESLKLAERFTSELHRNTAAGAEVLHRLTQIAGVRQQVVAQAERPAKQPAKSVVPDPKSIVAAAQAFTERALARSKAATA
jgi:hypothetical protein